MTLGDIINSYRKTHDLSMDDFSKLSGMSKAYISLLEKNKHPKTGKPIAPSIQSIKQSADAMHMDFNVLFSMIDSDVVINDTTSRINTVTQNDFHLSDLEKQIINKFRGADLIEQEMVLRALGIQEKREAKKLG